MRASTLRTWAMSFMLVAVMPIFFIAGLIHWRVQGLSETQKWVRQSYHFEHSLTEIVRCARLGETSERGYLLTGDKSYLEAYDRFSINVWPRFDHAFAETKDPDQIARFNVLKPLLQDKFEEMDDTLNLFKTNDKNAAIKLMSTNRGVKLMDKIVTVRDAMNAYQDKVIATRQKEFDYEQQRILGFCRFDALWSGSCVALALACLFLAQKRSESQVEDLKLSR